MIFGSVVAVLWFGAKSVLAGTLSPGTLGQFLLYSVFAAGSLGALSEVWGELSQAAGAAERIRELMREEPAIAAPPLPVALPEPASGALSFEAVQFAYPSHPGEKSLRGLSFTVRPGETVAIVGPSGAGKSTVFALLLRFYDPVSGRIIVDGADLRMLSPEALRRRIAIVPQDVTIFAASIHDNIAFGSPGATRTQVEAAARAAQADEFIRRLRRDTRRWPASAASRCPAASASASPLRARSSRTRRSCCSTRRRRRWMPRARRWCSARWTG